MGFPSFPAVKDPADVTDFAIDLSGELTDGDAVNGVSLVTIVPSNTGTPPASSQADLSLHATLFTGARVILWLAAGKDGWRYLVSVLVTTLLGRTFHRSVLLKVQSQ